MNTNVNNFEQEDGKVTTLMLVSGANIIGKVWARDNFKLWLSKPLAWQALPAHGQPGAWHLQMGPYIPAVVAFDPEKPFPFKNEQIMHEFAPSDNLLSPYVKATSGLILVAANSVPPVK